MDGGLTWPRRADGEVNTAWASLRSAGHRKAEGELEPGAHQWRGGIKSQLHR